MGINWRDIQEKELDNSLLKAIAQNANRFNPQDIANTLWALATMGINFFYWGYWRYEHRCRQLH